MAEVIQTKNMVELKLVSDFKRPKFPQHKVLSEEKNIMEFSAAPYERGFAQTVGNSLRRTLLSGLHSYAIIAVRFDKISNEYENIVGVYEDTTEICVNLRKTALYIKGESLSSKVLHFDIKGETVFTAAEFARDNTISVGNPEHVIFHANSESDFGFDVQINFGRGYVPSEVIEKNIEVRNTIALNADYSPVLNVAFEVEPMTMGNRNDFEKLKILIQTNGVLSPVEAMRKAAQILKECFLTFSDMEIEIPLTTAIDTKSLGVKSQRDTIYHYSVYSLSCLIPTHYFFKINNIMEIGEIVTMSEDDLRAKKKFSDLILEDIKNNLKEKWLTLNMKGVNYIQDQV